MTTALIIPFGADPGTENGRARNAIWARVRQIWAEAAADDVEQGLWSKDALPDRTLIVAGDPWFGAPTGETPDVVASVVNGAQWPRHPFSVSRAINRAVRLAPPEVDRFVCIGADALPDWRVVDWAAAELETRPWTLLFGKGVNVAGDLTEHFIGTGCSCITMGHFATAREFDTPCVGPIAFTREAFLAVRGFDERFEGWAYEDVDFWSRLRTSPATRQVIEARTSPYPLVQFDHPVDHHDLTDGNPNVRLWRAKCNAMPLPDGSRDNDHPATQLFGLDYTGQES